jgi:hypothetical protein
MRTDRSGSALLLTAVATGALSHEYCAADSRKAAYPTVLAAHDAGSPAGALGQTWAGPTDFNRTNVALIGTMVPAMPVAAMARSIERIRKVE